MADDENNEGEFDLSTIIPETFKGEDGKFDTEGFKTSYDNLAAFKAAEDDRASTLPKEPSEYAFALPEEHAFPEGFDPEAFKTKDDDGNDVEFDPSAMIDADDEDIPALQALLHELGAPADAMSKIAGIVINRELRQVMKASETAGEEKKALGPEGQGRIDTVTRTLNARLPKEQAKALADSITTADGLRGFEALIKKMGSTTTPAPNVPDTSNMSIDDRIMLGLSRNEKRA